MKKILFTLMLTTLALSSWAQKFGYVDTDKILNKMPEYTEAQKKLDVQAEEWQNEIARKYKEIDDMYKDYQAQQVLLTEDMKKRKEEEIIAKEKAAKELQKQRFGQSGDFVKKREDLIKPIQERVFNAIQKYANDRALDFIFDKSSGSSMLFSNPKFDFTQDILTKLGI